MKKRWFTQAHFDQQKTCIMLTDKMYQQYCQLEKQKVLMQEEAQRKAMARFVGMEEEVLVEGLSRRSDKEVSGHGRHGVSITFPGNKKDIGKIVRVRITAMKNNTLVGERID